MYLYHLATASDFLMLFASLHCKESPTHSHLAVCHAIGFFIKTDTCSTLRMLGLQKMKLVMVLGHFHLVFQQHSMVAILAIMKVLR